MNSDSLKLKIMESIWRVKNKHMLWFLWKSQSDIILVADYESKVRFKEL